MKETILRAFDVIIEDRVDNLAYQKLYESEEYKKVDGQLKELAQDFIASLTKDSQRELIDQLEGLSAMREGMCVEIAYRQGLEDSIKIQMELGALGIATQYKGGF